MITFVCISNACKQLPYPPGRRSAWGSSLQGPRVRAFRSPPRGRRGGPAAAGAALLEGLRGALAVVSQEYIHEYTQEYIHRRIHRSIYMTFNSFILQNFADFFLQEPQLKEETQLKRIEETQLKLEMNQLNLLSVFKCREQHVCIHTCMHSHTPRMNPYTFGIHQILTISELSESHPRNYL